MYHAIVRHKLKKAFAAINAGDYSGVVAQFAAQHRHAMYGRHALAGERRDLQSTARWYERLKRLLPDLRFEVDAVMVGGWPWDTRAAVSWRDRFTLPNGEQGSNQGVHVFRLAWGKVRSLDVHCDTARLEAYGRRMGELGVNEALAAPITRPA